MKLVSSRQIFEKWISILMEILPVGAVLFRVESDRWAGKRTE
jgi:hypothetical protein